MYRLSNSIYASPYGFYGLTRIHHSGTNSFRMEMSGDFFLKVDSSSSFLEFLIAYIVMGNLPNSVCKNCGMVTLVYGNSCVTSCPAKTYLFTFSDGGQGCVVCPGQFGMVVNSSNNGCECPKNSTTSNGLCYDAATGALIYNPLLATVYFNSSTNAIANAESLTFMPQIGQNSYSSATPYSNPTLIPQVSPSTATIDTYSTTTFNTSNIKLNAYQSSLVPNSPQVLPQPQSSQSLPPPSPFPPPPFTTQPQSQSSLPISLSSSVFQNFSV
jgi:hypothetical protein